MAGSGGLREALPKDLRVVGGLAFMYVWTWLLYWGGPFSLRTLTIELVNLRWAANVVMCCVAVGVVAVLACRGAVGRLRLPLRLCALVSCLLGTSLGQAILYLPQLGEVPTLVLALLSGVFTGVGEGTLLCLWCAITASLGVRMALSHNVAALVGGGVLFAICNLVPGWLSVILGVLVPVGGFLCARRAGGEAPAFSDDPADPADAPGGPARAADVSSPLPAGLDRVRPLLADRSFLMLAAIALVFGFSSGFMNASFEVVPKQVYWTSCHGVVIGTILAAALTFLAAFLLKMDAWQLVFRTSIPLMAAAYLLFPYELFWYVGPGLHALGYQYFFMTFWSLLGSKQLRHDVPALCSVSLGLFATELGVALGLCLWNATCAGIGAEGLRVMSSAAALVLLVAAVSFERPRFGWGNVRPGAQMSESDQQGKGYDDAMARLRERYGLSPREKDVCALLGRGRNRQFVADELGISLETAKTHATNVYRKLGIHSQQELLDVIEMTRETLARERQQLHDAAW